MTLKLSEMTSGKPKAPRIPESTYMGRIVAVIDLGIQPQTDWKSGDETDPKPRALITWELPTETLDFEDDEGNVTQRPRWISKEYTLSSYEQSNLYKLIANISPGTPEVSGLLDIPCMVNIGSTVNGNAKVVSVMKVPGGMEVDELANEPTFFDFDDPSEEIFLAQPNWIKEKIMDAINYDGFADSWKEEEAA